jgi:cyclophilin family peptidyl-prolyl cis-trans isomerase
MKPQPLRAASSWLATCLALILAMAHAASGAAPKPPKDAAILYTLTGLDSSGASKLGTVHTCQVKWSDQALDEEGYRIKISMGKPLAVVAEENFPADTTEVTLPLTTPPVAGSIIEARIQSWKREGASLATSTVAVVTYTIPTLPATEATLQTPELADPVSIGDNGVELSWTDRNNSELFHQVFIHDRTAEQTLDFAPFGGLAISSTGAFKANTIQRRYFLRPIPGRTYDIYLRATRRAGSNLSATEVSPLSPSKTWIAPALTPVSLLRATSPSDDRVELSWQDNSNNETGYEILRSPASENNFSPLGTMAANSTSLALTVISGSSWKWKVRPVYTHTPAGQSSETIVGADSAIVTSGLGFPKPGSLTARGDEGLDRTATLSWQDISDSEFGYNIETRPEGETAWSFAVAVPANVTQVRVNRRATGQLDADGVPTFTPLETSGRHEFRVTAVANDGSTLSLPSDIAVCSVREGFIGKMAIGAQVGTALQPYLPQANGSPAPSLSAQGLPPGLQWNGVTSSIEGTPTQSGVFTSTLLADYAEAPDVSTSLIFRILPQAQSPVRIRNLGNNNRIRLGPGKAMDIDLWQHLADPDAGTTVLVETNKPLTNGATNLADDSSDFFKFKLRLYSEVAPATVNNFLSYVRAGDYNEMVFHRLVNGFVLQGGSLRSAGPGNQFRFTDSRQPPLNEPGISNTAFTLSAAKIGARSSPSAQTSISTDIDDDHGYLGNPNSATTDFFINLANNNDASNRLNLDDQNGGFTVFGRVGTGDVGTSNGPLLAGIINALGVTNYLDANSTQPSDPNLDHRLSVSGSRVPYSSFPTLTDPSPVNPDSAKSFRITSMKEIPSLTFAASSSNTSIAQVSVNPQGIMRVTARAIGTCDLYIRARDADESALNLTVPIEVVSGHVAASITRQPTPVIALPGSNVTLSVGASGTGPLSFQWYQRANEAASFVPVPNGSGPSLSMTGIVSSQFAQYKVLVSNASRVVESQVVSVTQRSAPSGGNLVARLGTPSQPLGLGATVLAVELGKPFHIQFENLAGNPSPAVVWKRNSATLGSQKTAVYSVAAAKLTDAGVYLASATNTAGKINAGSQVRIVVYDPTPPSIEFKPGQNVTLAAPVAGPGLSYAWSLNAAALDSSQPRYASADEPILKLQSASLSDAGNYTCSVSIADASFSMTTAAIALKGLQIPSLPALSGDLAPPRAALGSLYSWQVPIRVASDPKLSWRPSSISISGLPSGLKVDLNGLVTGRPLAAGSFPLRIILKNAAGTAAAVTCTLEVQPMPAANAGSFVATVNPANFNAQLGGLLQLTIEDTGSYSVSLNLGRETLRGAGVVRFDASLSGDGGMSYQGSLALPRSAGGNLDLVFELEPIAGYVQAQISDGLSSASAVGYRRYWDATFRPCNTYGLQPSIENSTSAKYNAIWQPATDASALPSANQPQGSAYSALTVAPTGNASLSGRLADGTSFTFSSYLGPRGELGVFVPLYSKAGSLLAEYNIREQLVGKNLRQSRRGLDGSARWIKLGSAPASLLYPTGINASTFTILGCSYNPPASNKLVIDLPPTTSGTANANLLFSGAKINLSSVGQPNGAVRLLLDGSGNRLTQIVGTNTHRVSLSVNAATGLFGGSFRIVQAGINRDATFSGMLVPSLPYTPEIDDSGTLVSNEVEGRSALAEGYFLLPDLESSAKTPLLYSGRTRLLPQDLAVIAAPSSRAILAGQLLTLSVQLSAGSQGTGNMTYRWRKNGVGLPSGTFENQGLSHTLNLGPATTALSGNYDCEINNGAVTIIAPQTPASILVTSTSIARLPSTATVAAGQSITFTATTDLSNPTFQWYKGDAVIENATQSSYNIPSASTTDSGQYKVLVTNSAVPQGIYSLINSLTVTN